MSDPEVERTVIRFKLVQCTPMYTFRDGPDSDHQLAVRVMLASESGQQLSMDVTQPKEAEMILARWLAYCRGDDPIHKTQPDLTVEPWHLGLP